MSEGKKKRGRPKKSEKKLVKKVDAAKKLTKKQKIEEEKNWWEEPIKSGLKSKCKLVKVTADVTSPFQKIGIIELVNFGKVLTLDGFTQSAQRDEFIYHESLAHPALLHHPNPKTVFIGGGGEMATAREILKHKSVEKLIMCDIDKKVVDLSCEHLEEWGGPEVFKDPRFECYYEDAKKFIQEYKGKFDVVVMDIADPIEAGPGIALYFQEFYKNLLEKVNPGFVFVTQSGPCGLLTKEECFTTINKTLSSVFDVVVPMHAHIPSFHDLWGWNLAYNNHTSLTPLPAKSPEVIDKLIKERLKDDAKLQFYDGIGHKALFSVAKYVREAIAKETRIMTETNPVFMDANYNTAGVFSAGQEKDKSKMEE
jgi:spermidine synthase